MRSCGKNIVFGIPTLDGSADARLHTGQVAVGSPIPLLLEPG